MTHSDGIPVTGPEGHLGVAVVQPGENRQYITLILTDGLAVDVLSSALVPQADGSFSLPLRRADLDRHAEAVLPVISEELIVSKKQVPTGSVRVSKTVRLHEEIVALPVLRERVDVRRVVLDREVDGPLPIRYEGDTIIVPVVEEVLVIEKRLRLKEELHITRRTTEEQIEEHVTLQREEAIVQRLDADGRVISTQSSTELPEFEPPTQ